MNITCKSQPGNCKNMKYNRCPCRLEIYGCNENCKCLCKANSINGQSPKAQKSKVVQFKKNKNNPNTFVSSKHGITNNNNINPYHIYYDHTPSVNTISTCKILPCDGTDKCKFKCTKAIISNHLKDKHNS
ncbi:hypothetical protein ACTFIW_008380 [Dictyostelium discoideum]